MYDGNSGSRGQIEVVPCLYQFLCRLVVHRMDGTPLPFTYKHNKTSDITFLGNIRGSLAIDYVALIPGGLAQIYFDSPFPIDNFLAKIARGQNANEHETGMNANMVAVYLHFVPDCFCGIFFPIGNVLLSDDD